MGLDSALTLRPLSELIEGARGEEAISHSLHLLYFLTLLFFFYKRING